MYRRILSLAIALPLVTLLAAGGCQGIVGDAVPSFRCDSHFDAGVCPAGQYCLGTTCVPNGTLALDAAVVQCGDTTCAPGQVCAPKTNQCIDGATACTAGSCQGTEVCDFGTRQCVKPAEKQLGEGCKADVECVAGTFCGYSPVLTSDVVKADGVCTKPCCKSTDCPADFVCYGAGTGGNYCVGKGVLQRPALGARAGGESCTVQADCRSGVCDATNKCADTCCHASHCTNDTVCRAIALQGVGTSTKYVLGCGAPEGQAKVGDSCEVILAGKCAQGACEDGTDKCRTACRNSNDCTTYCDNTKARSHADIITVCTESVSPKGTRQLGEACDVATQCVGNRCIQDSPEGTKYCSDACSTDAECASAGLVCRPRDAGQGRYVLRCVRS
ncbi:hypothetical protein LVJ94_33325 [Pendulispora rubella]|uniref:Dickkopf N-terminal cysteine-rich domain-containing protein n=1 Tax=Pendulispora rubella TaxID=2741070 RepID=A0ABZ2KW50_9BACT